MARWNTTEAMRNTSLAVYAGPYPDKEKILKAGTRLAVFPASDGTGRVPDPTGGRMRVYYYLRPEMISPGSTQVIYAGRGVVVAERVLR